MNSGHLFDCRACIPESYQIGCLKIIYLTCATVITTTVIIECILAHLVVQPYIHESAFTQTNCSFVHAYIVKHAVKCENRCSKDRSRFPCLRILVRYTSNGLNHTVILFDNIATYQHYKVLGCATSSCHHRDADNMAYVHRFEHEIKHRSQFKCYIHATHEDEALLTKFYSANTLFHAIFWPVSLFVAAVMCVGFAYFVDRCRAWTGDQSVIV
ncbi:Calcium-activated potassium channel subunit beta-2 [Paragonimus heterotremus]|uniref:Calcium-activated potassium channel subunit beta-2 n=1 Tax=Paragonimus heterotremus TaxID=100268 RepID=A0A8J4TEB5_9TREM|nr:Calcium-activated potassium channel subunit beta-2 [Paragonimus heterotremus]